jgi:NAD(P)-dependent dehydrogenase (short-subunit alcohol dehydrogenase family)
MAGEKRVSEPLRCLVFGGSGALGRVVCATLAEQGARVAFTWHSGEAVMKDLLPRLPGGLARRLDLRSVAEIEKTIDEVAQAFGGIDAFVQCAAVALTGPASGPKVHHLMGDVDEAGWDGMMDVNVKSTFFAARKVAKVMKRGGGGNIVLVGSIDGVKSVPSPVHYAAAKGALGGMTLSMAKELGEHQVRVNLIAPGILEAGLSRILPEELLQEYLKHCGLKRTGKLAEIAALLAWFARKNSYVTGQTILADGGL